MRVSQERTLEGRLFQIAGAAERKPRAPNEMLQRVTERRLAEADSRFLDGVCHWTRLARYGGLQVYIVSRAPSVSCATQLKLSICLFFFIWEYLPNR